MKKDSNGNPLGKSRGLRKAGASTADWESASAELLRKAIAAAAMAGGCLRLGYSRDGGAYSIGIYGDGEPYTEWVRPSEDVDETLEKIIELFQAIQDDQSKGAKRPEGR